MYKRKLFWFFLLTPILLFGLSIPELTYTNSGVSHSTGSPRKGSLEKAYLLPYSGSNYSYFSPTSYYLMNCGYVNHRVYHAVLDAYKDCELKTPNTYFRIMECSRPDGGKMLIHRTHQNGLSVDFMVPKIKKNKQFHWLDRLGMSHYLLKFNNNGKSNISSAIEIDFESIGTHLLALDDACRGHGLGIRKVILKIELQDDLFKTAVGKELRNRGVYFVRALTPIVNQVHDDHYHVDFKVLR